MLYLNHTYNLLTGGFYSGNSSWNKEHTEVDNCFKVYQLIDGEACVCDKTQTFSLQKNNLYFINGNKLSKQYCSCSFSTYWLHFIPKDFTIYRGLLSLPTVIKLPAERINLRDLVPKLEILLTSTVSSSWEYSLNILDIQTSLQIITLELFAQYPTIQLSEPVETQRIEPAINYMNQYYKESIKLSQLANLCCMSPNYFHKIFRNTLNITPANYLTLLRMNAALQLLTDRQQTIKSIAYELGFTDNAYFCRSFKKYYGISPKEYQKKRKDIIL